MDNNMLKEIASSKCSDGNRLGFYYLQDEICKLEQKIKECTNILPDDLLLSGFQYINAATNKLIAANESLLGFIREPEFSYDEIKQQISCAASQYIKNAVIDKVIYYNEDDACYYDEEGCEVVEECFAETDYCRSCAYLDLYEEYRKNHPNGAQIDNRLFLLSYNCRQNIAILQDRQSFIESVKQFSKEYIDKPLSLLDFIIKEREKTLNFIDNELKACRTRQGKLIAMMIIVLHEVGNLVQYNGKLSDIHKAFKDAYPGKVGALTGIVDYINSYNNDEYTGDKQIKMEDLIPLRNKLK